MSIFYEKGSQTFHLTNGMISYIMKILPNNQIGQLYFGKAVQHRESFDHLLEIGYRSMSSCVFESDLRFSMEHIKQEYPSYGTGDYRHPAVGILQENGSHITNFVFESYRITKGKPGLEGLPATYCESDDEAETLCIVLCDELTQVRIELLYTLFAQHPAIARSARFVNKGTGTVHLDTAMSLSLDLPDCEYDWVQLSGAWARERHIRTRRLEWGVQSIESTRGHSSHNHNPFIMLKRPNADERQGEVIGFSLVYSGNFLARAEVDTWGVTRITMGINPFRFTWKLKPGNAFQTPEAVVVYTEDGINAMSQTFHKLYQKRLARGYWRDRPRPILLNNWEATYFDFTEKKLLDIAGTAKAHGIEMFVLDDGWFGARRDDTAGLGDWVPNCDLLPNGIAGLAEKIEEIGLKFGLWFEPEMVNKNSDLYRKHPDWVIYTPDRAMSHGRNQFVLDYSRKEVVDHIFGCMAKILREAKVSYIKWDMNRSITEAFSQVLPTDQQGELFHRYILGVYDLYERLTSTFPHVLFESCASGGARFDPGLLYYAPQAWTSDDSDAIERLKIQYGTSLCYPISSIGAHVSKCPNEQVFRNTPIETRANVACFGTFGYEMNLQLLSEEEKTKVCEQIAFMKQYRELLQFGTFYRLISPFENNFAAWMTVSEDKKTAIVGWYKLLNEINGPFHRVRLCGLDENIRYRVDGAGSFGGDELMNIGLITSDSASCTDNGAAETVSGVRKSCDFDSRLFILTAEE